MNVSPYFTFDGNCAEAVEFYQQVFKATNKGLMRFGDMPNQEHPVPDEAKNRVLHAELEFEGNRLLFSDTFPGNPYSVGDQLSLAVTGNDEQTVRSIYNALLDGGQTIMELQKTFWSPCFGMLRDKFGVTWQLSTESNA